MLGLVLFLCIALPVAWLVSETQSRRWISVVLGIAAIAVIGVVASGISAFTTGIDKNLYFGDANHKLLKAVSEEFERGKVELVRRELNRFAKDYHPSYEDFPRYGEEVDRLVTRLREAGPAAESTSKSTSTITADGGHVTVSGEYHTSGKFGPYIPVGDTSVYLVAEGSSSWPDLEGQRVEVTGQLRLALAGVSIVDAVARAPERLLLTTTPESIVTKGAQ